MQLVLLYNNVKDFLTHSDKKQNNTYFRDFFASFNFKDLQ